MLRIAGIVLLSALLAGAARADEPAPSRWELGGSLWTVSPSALPGVAVGGAAQLLRRTASGRFFVAGRLAYASTQEANTDWTISQHEPAASLLAGLELRLGAGSVRAAAGIGARFVVQDVARQQVERLEALHVPDTRHVDWVASPQAMAEVAVSLAIVGPWSVEVAGGPWLGSLQVNGSTRLDWGGQGRVGVGLAF